MEIPEYVYGIPTKKAKSKERVELIKDYYFRLWKKLQKEGRNNSVFNKFLGVDVFIVEKESDLYSLEKLAVNICRQAFGGSNCQCYKAR